MKTSFYLVVSKSGSVAAKKNKPHLAFDEIAILQNLELPDALFKKPALEATVTIPNEAALPQQIEADVVANVKEAIQQSTGLEVRLSIVKDENE